MGRQAGCASEVSLQADITAALSVWHGRSDQPQVGISFPFNVTDIVEESGGLYTNLKRLIGVFK